jgi:hypothetical protein
MFAKKVFLQRVMPEAQADRHGNLPSLFIKPQFIRDIPAFILPNTVGKSQIRSSGGI